MGGSAIMAFAKKLIMNVLAKNVRKAFDAIKDSVLSNSMRLKSNSVNPWALERINFTVVISKSIGACIMSRDPIFVDTHGLVFLKISIMNAVLALLANLNFIMKAHVLRVRKSVRMSNNA